MQNAIKVRIGVEAGRGESWISCGFDTSSRSLKGKLHQSWTRFPNLQPPFIAAFQELEEYIGAELFIRDHRRVELTHVGKRLLPEARAAIAEFDHALEVARSASKGDVSIVTIAISGGLGEILEMVLSEHQKSGLGVKLEYKDISSKDQAVALRQREVDIGFSRSKPDQEHLNAAYLFSEHIVALLPPSHPLHRNSIKLRDVANAPLLLSNPRRSPIHDKVLQLFRKAGVPTGTISVLSGTWLSEAEQLRMQSEQAICFVTESTCAQMKSSWCTVPLDEPDAYGEVSVAWRKSERSRAVLDFLDSVRKFFENKSAPTLKRNQETWRHNTSPVEFGKLLKVSQ